VSTKLFLDDKLEFRLSLVLAFQEAINVPARACSLNMHLEMEAALLPSITAFCFDAITNTSQNPLI